MITRVAAFYFAFCRELYLTNSATSQKVFLDAILLEVGHYYSTMEGEQQPQKIVERIKNTKETLGVSRRQLEQEFARLTERGDDQAKKELSDIFNAYLSWELRKPLKDRTPDDIRSMALGNFDVVAEVADSRKAWDYNLSTFSSVSYETKPHPIGKVRQFYRNAVGYNPPNPPSPLIINKVTWTRFLCPFNRIQQSTIPSLSQRQSIIHPLKNPFRHN